MIGFFPGADGSSGVAMLVCEECRQPVLRADLAMVFQVRDMRESIGERYEESKLGTRGVIIHKGACDEAFVKRFPNITMPWRELEHALASSLFRAGIDTFPDSWLEIAKAYRPLRITPGFPLTGIEMYVDDHNVVWETTHVDVEAETVTLRQDSARADKKTVGFSDLMSQYQKLQDRQPW